MPLLVRRSMPLLLRPLLLRPTLAHDRPGWTCSQNPAHHLGAVRCGTLKPPQVLLDFAAGALH